MDRERELGRLLIEQGTATAEQVNECLSKIEETGGKLVDLLVEKGSITPEAQARTVKLQESLSGGEGRMPTDVSRAAKKRDAKVGRFILVKPLRTEALSTSQAVPKEGEGIASAPVGPAAALRGEPFGRLGRRDPSWVPGTPSDPRKARAEPPSTHPSAPRACPDGVGPARFARTGSVPRDGPRGSEGGAQAAGPRVDGAPPLS